MSHRVELDAAKLHDELLTGMPAGARHDASTCPFCVDTARREVAASGQQQEQIQDPVPGIPPADGRSGASTTEPIRDTEGGTPAPMPDEAKTISQETHEALLTRAVTEATKTTDAALQTKVTELAAATEKIATLTTENETLKSDNARLNGELDTAQVAKKSAEDKAAQLEKDVAERDTAAQLAQVKQERVDQARNLQIWSDDDIASKADRWAQMDSASWEERVAEWSALKPTGSGTRTETASAMTGSSGGLATDHTKPGAQSEDKGRAARRSALSLDLADEN